LLDLGGFGERGFPERTDLYDLPSVRNASRHSIHSDLEIGQPPVGQLPWTHHLVLSRPEP